MISRSGSLVVTEGAPYVYAILKERFIYLGETQRPPVTRWGEHLGSDGSFTNALRRSDEEVFARPTEIRFFAYRCDRIAAEVGDLERKLVTQYVEHQLHVRFVTEASRLGKSYELLSDTTRTAPRSCKYAWAGELARATFEVLVSDIAAGLP